MRSTLARRQARSAWLFLAPAGGLIGLFFFLPVVAGLLLSLTDFDIYAIGSPGTARFVGLRNFSDTLSNPVFWGAVHNTLYFVLVGGPLSVAVSLGAALLLEARLVRSRSFFRTIYFAPVVTTLVAVAIVWRYLYHPRYGLLNHVLGWLGLGPIDWLGDPHWAMPAIILLAVWKNFGYNMLIFMAGLQSIPQRLYEAAAIDGAGPWRRFLHITLPGLAPVFLFVAVTTMIGYFQLFAEPYVMTQGGPLGSTRSVVLLMYEEGFRWWRMGIASTIAVLLLIFTLIGALVQMRLARGRLMTRKRLGVIALHAALMLGAIVTLTPLVWMLAASFMPAGAANTIPPRFLPREPTLAQYVALFTRLNMALHFLNSALVTVTATVVSVLVNAMAGYAFAKLPFPGRDRVFQRLALGLVVPAQVGMLPLFLLLRQMGLVNTYLGAMIPYFASIYGIFLIRQYALSVSSELLDAARIDGAGEFRIFWTIVLPIIKPILVTLAAFTFLSAWNDFMWPLIILSDSSMYTLPVALANLVGEHVQDTELMMAGSVVTTIPALVVFLVFQRTYVRGIMAGGIKG